MHRRKHWSRNGGPRKASTHPTRRLASGCGRAGRLENGRLAASRSLRRRGASCQYRAARRKDQRVPARVEMASGRVVKVTRSPPKTPARG